MARDFAKVAAPARSVKKREGGSILSVLGIVVIAGLCFAAGFWLGGNQNQPATDGISRSDLEAVRSQLEKKGSEADVLQAKIETLQDQVAQWKAKAGAGAHTKVGDLKFYQELPKQSVTPSSVPDSNPAAARPMGQTVEVAAPGRAPAAPVIDASTADHVTYRVQLGSFKTRDEAASLQLKLMKAGFTAFIHSVNLPDRGQWFRVYAGPYANKDLASDAVRHIQEKMKIRGLLVREG
ncbi:SPOR domain-containing protein [Mariprofundus sp. KV]|uniref:SPOR domain-containing protein n=1 Tax=Mariprofundus sp. KV TaxID=2608715 RepID=UPI0015A3AB65|nr:SPOR domain-containing protein [Mariprofundus sp. KV]NWF37293.1 SPOR domain-containing protein [Mariprofundus sp. KV]